jgi:hypothetical protein
VTRLTLLLTMLAMAAGTSAQIPATAPADGLAGVQVDPIRCWWRTSAGGVRIGEAFELSLTCAVLETDAVQVVPDQSHLDPAVATLTPFEVLGGSHPADLRSGQRRFFQYHYRLRIISPDAIGQDVRLAEMSIHYKVNTRMAANMALQGRDLVYFLPPQSIRVASLVPTDAGDIRDQAGESFAAVDALRLRAGTLDIVAAACTALGVLVALVVGAGAVRRAVRRAPAAQRSLGAHAIARAALSELAAVQQARGTEGWTDALGQRAVTALRVAAAAALDRPIGQRVVRAGARGGAGRLKVTRPLSRKARLVWSAVTTSDLERDLARIPAEEPDASRAQTVEALRDGLATFSSLQYGRPADKRDEHALDVALGRALEAAGRVQTDHAWPRRVLRLFRRPSDDVGESEP